MPANPDCPHCGGTGWKEVIHDGVTGVARCACVRPPAAEDLLRQSGIPPRFENAGFDNFSVGRHQDNPVEYRSLTEAFVAAQRFAKDYLPCGEQGRNGLLFQSTATGTGKTHLAVAVLRELIRKGYDGVFLDYQQWLRDMRSAYDSLGGTEHRTAYGQATDATVILLDDLGSDEGKAIIATTNLPIKLFGDPTREKDGLIPGKYNIKDSLAERIGTRAMSRLLGMCQVIRIDTRDYRERGLGRAAGS
jgi:DNA replication protein DnaC